MISHLMLAVLALSVPFSQGNFLEPEIPVTYCPVGQEKESCRAKINLFVNRLTSDKSIIPYEYHDFDFCTAVDEGEYYSPMENLGQIILGDRIRHSPYEIEFMKENQNFLHLCTKTYNGSDPESLKKLTKMKKGMELEYKHHWIIDNMPVTWCYIVGGDSQYCSTDFPMGCYIDKNFKMTGSCGLINSKYTFPDTYYVFNHVDLVITYHSGKLTSWGRNIFGLSSGQILSIKLQPYSRKVTSEGFYYDPEPMAIPGEALKPDEQIEVTYTYSYKFVQNNEISWPNRWEYILDPPRTNRFTNIRWFSILNSWIVALILAGPLVIVLVKNLRKDETNDNGLLNMQQSGWKAIYADVFRKPSNAMLLSALVGSGVQLLSMVAIFLALACLGIVSPAKRGSLMTSALVLYACLGCVGGYTSSRLYRSFGGGNWKKNVLLSGVFSPGLVLAFYLAMNLVFLWEKSSALVPGSTLLKIVGLWLGVSLPLAYVGAYFGFVKQPTVYPTKPDPMPRQIPHQKIYARRTLGILMGGVLPFGTIFIQLYFFLDSIWNNQEYNLFAWHSLVLMVLAVTSFEVTILLCYLHLNAEDYNWWWRSFFTGGSTAFFVGMYCIQYFFARLDIVGFSSVLLYFISSAILGFLIFLLTGTIGFVSCFWFVRKLYSSVKIQDGKPAVLPVYTVLQST